MIATSVSHPPLDGWTFVFSKYEFEIHRYEFFLEVRAEGFTYVNNILHDLRDYCKEKANLTNPSVYQEAFGQPCSADTIVR